MSITVAQMIEALSQLPPDAKLVVTQSGYYSDGEFAEIMLPESCVSKYGDKDLGIKAGDLVYRIGHSHQSY